MNYTMIPTKFLVDYADEPLTFGVIGIIYHKFIDYTFTVPQIAQRLGATKQMIINILMHLIDDNLVETTGNYDDSGNMLFQWIGPRYTEKEAK